jgi:NhaP-type Na+/H+ or K+/H+ antiporter
VLAVHESQRPLFSFAVGMLIFTVAAVSHANSYLAAFTAGITLVTIQPRVRASFHPFAEPLTELLKLAALLVFGAVISFRVVQDITAADYVFAGLALFIARPVAITISLLGSRLTAREILVAGWFGPKGFASVVYGLLILQANPKHAHHLAHLIAIVVIGSILAHSSTDVLVAHWFRARPSARENDEAEPPSEPAR